MFACTLSSFDVAEMPLPSFFSLEKPLLTLGLNCDRAAAVSSLTVLCKKKIKLPENSPPRNNQHY